MTPGAAVCRPIILPPPEARLLVRGVNWLGDAVMTTPALLRLREAHPRARITLLTSAKLTDLWSGHPAVDAVISFTAKDNAWSVAHRLRRGRFDAALILPNSPRSALEAWLAGIPVRVGLARPWRNWLLTHCVPPRAGEVTMQKRSLGEIRRQAATNQPRATFATEAHHLHQYLHLASALRADPAPVDPQLFIGPAEVASARARFGPEIKPDRPLFGLNAGAEYGAAKRWPAERFIAAAVELHRRTGAVWWVFGGPADTALANTITQEVRARSGSPDAAWCLAGATSLRELCAALKACDLLLTNDTGPMHVAAAVGTPVVVPFGSTSPELTGPGRPGDSRHARLRGEAGCAPCFLRECPLDLRCLHSITSDAVVTATLTIWSRRAARLRQPAE